MIIDLSINDSFIKILLFYSRGDQIAVNLLPVILPSATTSLLVDISESRGSGAHFLGAHGPGLAELLRILYRPAASCNKVVLDLGIEITAETAQPTPIRGRRGYLEKADAVPEDLDPDLRVDDHTLGRTIDIQ